MQQRNKILLDASYINNGGGAVLLNYYLEVIFNNNSHFRYVFIFDSRFKVPDFIKREDAIIYYSSNTISRTFSYIRILLKYNPSTIFNLNNLPPPIPIIRKRCFIYFHNVLLLNKPSKNNNVIAQISFYLKFFYLKLLNRSGYFWIVQTDLVVNLLVHKLCINKKYIFSIPFFRESKLQLNVREFNSTSNSFIYVADGEKHKNHDFILTSWDLYFSKFKYSPKLFLTFDELKYPKLANKVKLLIDSGLDIINLGVIDHKEILNLYRSIKFVLFFSEFESFGLPLIEAAQCNKYILTCDKDYVYKIIKPSASFSSSNYDGFVDYLNKILNHILIPNYPILKVENKINSLLNKIENNV